MSNIENSMSAKRKLFTNELWVTICQQCMNEDISCDAKYHESLCVSYTINPLFGHVASQNIGVFDPKKAAAMYFWYKAADREDASIIRYFPEYEHCIDSNHKKFNSNYGYYAKDGLKYCINQLLSHKSSRQACFMINNNAAMGPDSIDKLCTNAIMFFIRHDCLYMIVQMRSSNLLTLLPYDIFIFSTWYAKVYNALVRDYPELKIAQIKVQVASLHYYQSDFNSKVNITEKHNVKYLFSYANILDHNFENILEGKLIDLLNA